MKFCYRMMRSWAFRRIRARHVVGWLACEYFEYAVHAPGSAGVRRHAGAHKQGRGRVGGRAGAGGQGSASEDERRSCP